MATIGSGNTASLPSGYAVTVGTVAQFALPYNPTRNGLIFYNNSASALITVAPSSQYLVASGATPATAGQTSTPSGTVTGPIQGLPVTNGPGCVTLSPGQAFIIDNLNCSSAWNAISNTAGGALTVLEH